MGSFLVHGEMAAGLFAATHGPYTRELAVLVDADGLPLTVYDILIKIHGKHHNILIDWIKLCTVPATMKLTPQFELSCRNLTCADIGVVAVDYIKSKL